MDRTSLKTSFYDDVCLSSLFPEIIDKLKKLELLNSNYSFKVFDNNNKEVKRTFSTKESVKDNNQEIRSILKELIFIFETINFDRFKSFSFTTQINNYSDFVLISNFDIINKRWNFEINNS